jgi:cytidylate kinase
MENLFLKYMRERAGKPFGIDTTQGSHKPVITISREYGCPGVRIAERLAEILTAKNQSIGFNQEWKWISKEIIEEAAHKLKITPSLIEDLSDKKERSFFENIALFFSDEFYPIDVKVRNTIANFIHSAATEGYVVIVGRAAEIITHNFKRSCHISLYAPIEWRAEVVSISEDVPISVARKLCLENDQRRENYRKFFRGDEESRNFFDVIFNCKEMSDDEILEMIMIVAETRGFV